MPIEIHPLTLSDIPASTAIAQASFANDPFHQSNVPSDLTPAQQEEYLTWREGMLKLRMSKPGALYFKAVDSDTGLMVGSSGFHPPERPGEEDTGPRWPGSPSFMLNTARNAAMFVELRERALGKRRDVWFLQTMSVLPEYQGRGIGRMLMDAGLKFVDEDGTECYVEATPVATPLYVKCGFKVMEKEVLMDGTYTLTCLLRPAMKDAGGTSN